MRIVIALGGNALLQRGQPMTAENQRANIRLAAERIAAGQFDEPITDSGSDEVGELARAFDRMRLRLAQLNRCDY
mgnify:CR=1 FL=1